jgi:hypothetical protein
MEWFDRIGKFCRETLPRPKESNLFAMQREPGRGMGVAYKLQLWLVEVLGGDDGVGHE